MTARDICISTNYYHLKKMVKSEGMDEMDNHEFLISAAKWCYRRFGFGVASLDGYLDYLERKQSIRLYSTNVKAWYEIIRKVFNRDKHTCQYCSQVGGKLEVDHVIPFSKGGTNDLNNLVTSCRRCNRQKKDKSVDEFLTWRKQHGTTC